MVPGQIPGGICWIHSASSIKPRILELCIVPLSKAFIPPQSLANYSIYSQLA